MRKHTVVCICLLLVFPAVLKAQRYQAATLRDSMLPRVGALLPQHWKPVIDPAAFKEWMPAFPVNQTAALLRAKPLDLGKTEIISEGFYWPTDSSLIPSSFGQLRLHQQVNVFSIPVRAELLYNNRFLVASQDLFNYSFQYDQPAFLQNMAKQLGNIDTKALLSSQLQQDILARVHALMDDQLTTWTQQYQDIWSTVQDRLGDPRSLLQLDMAQVRSRLLPDSLEQQVLKYREQLAFLQGQQNILTSNNRAEINDLIQKLAEFGRKQELLANIQLAKNKWNNSGWVSAIQEAEGLERQRLEELLRSPEMIKKLAREKLNLNSLQRLFLNMSSLNVGQATLNQGMAMQQFLSRGLLAQFLSAKGNFFSFSHGRNEAFPSVFDMPFTGFAQANTTTATSVTVGKGAVKENHTHFSLSHYQGRQQSNMLNSRLNALLQKSTVIGMNKSIEIGTRGRLEADISKSISDFSFARSAIDSFGQNQPLLKSMLQGNMLQSLAFGVDYSNTIEKWQFDHRIFVRHAGVNYNNPGNIFLPSGSTEMGAQFRKLAYKGRFVLQARLAARRYKFDETADTRYQHLNALVDLKWRFRRGQFISIRYQPTSFRQINDLTSVEMSSMSRLSVDGQLLRRISGIPYRAFFSLSHQQNAFRVNALSEEQSFSALMVNLNQQVTLGKNTWFLNTIINHTVNKSRLAFFNSAINMDGGAGFSIGKQIMASSSLTYNQVQGWYSQAGIRQSVMAGTRSYQFHLNLDLRKNIRVENPLFMENFRINWSVRYFLNNK